MNIKSLITGLALAAFAGASAMADVAAIRPLAGGVTFRTDDNGTSPEYFRQRAAIFDKHGLKFGAAVNLLAAESQPGIIEALREIQKNGHDLMDHTPSHNNFWMKFSKKEDIAWIQDQPGVDHIDKKNVYLKYVLTVPPPDRKSRKVNVTGNRLTPVETEGAERWFSNQSYLYFPESKVVCRLDNREAVNGVYLLQSPWGEDNIDLKTLSFCGLLPLALGGLERVSRLRNLLTGAVTEIRQDPALGPVLDLSGGAAYEWEGKE